MIIQERLEEVLRRELLSGAHDSYEDGMCFLEAAAYIAGEKHSDHPDCVCPVLAAFGRSWNDCITSDADRDRLLKPLLGEIIGSKATEAIEKRRSYMALDWLIRVQTPKFLELVPALQEHAKSLRDMEEIADMAGATAAGEKINAAGAAAWAAARAAAGDAARAAARDAARDAAWDAAGAAARDAAWDAAGAAAGAAAWDAAGAAAWAAAGAAAWAAARDALKPTVEWLQISATDLVRRMLSIGAS